jgi:coproporphyrinogen III oxidase-like Fe-S oxidoreductase
VSVQPEPATAGREAPEQDVGSVFVANYPPFSAWSAEAVPQALAALAALPEAGSDFGLYLHIPFCRKRCKFCYFRVYTDKNYDEIGVYLEALAREVELFAAQPAIASRRPRFVYFGGGTPSFISVKQLRALVDRVQAAIPWTGAEEVTFECEPGTLTRPKLEAIRDVGVTRLSLGVESWDDGVLRENGRAHVSTEIDRCLPWIAELGFEQLNIDLIAGMVGETEETWRRSVERTIAAAPDSVTIYQMELPYNTRYATAVHDGTLPVALVDWPTKRRWHDEAFAALEGAGYELSSAYTMVRRGKPCRFVYRDAVWHGCDMLGTGVASFSHLSGVHFQNVDGWGEYLARLGTGDLPLGRAFQTTPRERLVRELILQLKLGRIDPAYFAAKFGVDVIAEFAPAWQRLAADGMLLLSPAGPELTRAGLFQVDRLLPEFYADEYRNARYT